MLYSLCTSLQQHHPPVPTLSDNVHAGKSCTKEAKGVGHVFFLAVCQQAPVPLHGLVCRRPCAAVQLDDGEGGEPDAAPAPLELRFPDSRGLVARHAWLSDGRLLVGFSNGEQRLPADVLCALCLRFSFSCDGFGCKGRNSFSLHWQCCRLISVIEPHHCTQMLVNQGRQTLSKVVMSVLAAKGW